MTFGDFFFFSSPSPSCCLFSLPLPLPLPLPFFLFCLKIMCSIPSVWAHIYFFPPFFFSFLNFFNCYCRCLCKQFSYLFLFLFRLVPYNCACADLTNNRVWFA
ncbi:hypothetical protein, unlikely [Trypanosoma brucei brucei TREU927]|uniref:Uncharacterized protein n=1 Tax=Trypanosoma brucei brucei (strain 927/4 GUTat10.1) TaxID=185431 RepID=Q38D77_TRYB2|nr:hypothetical protein, unlikely [Trypanosoma brucei brucei TREU927]EAN77243.1 hypothetical protein, unlikely [Trypanosoma brucei brucei TREU927]